jgi:KDO2-lipid IV(A) lauroyltransferase
MALGRWLPPWAGYGIARAAVSVVSRRRSLNIYRILYANQAGVLGPDTPEPALHDAVRRVFEHIGLTAYDLMHGLAGGDVRLRTAVTFDEQMRDNVQRAVAIGRGVMICGCHTSNFNLGFLALSLHDETPEIQVLAPPTMTGGFRVMHELRASRKFIETPINMASLKATAHRLAAGGLVATGVDWPPAATTDDWLPFFGQPAHLPTGHIRLAINANAVLLPVACRWDAERGYRLMIAPHLELELTGDRDQDIQHNARRVLTIIEQWIAEQPEQWLMYYPVWPQPPAGAPARSLTPLKGLM